MRNALAGGFAYFAIVFAAGFVLGTIRTLALLPRFGETNAVLMELPFMLAISWIASGWIIQRFRVPPQFAVRAVMGLGAFALLMTAELALSVFVFERTVAEFLADLASPPGAIGLAGQVLFGVMPLARR